MFMVRWIPRAACLSGAKVNFLGNRFLEIDFYLIYSTVIPSLLLNLEFMFHCVFTGHGFLRLNVTGLIFFCLSVQPWI